jgi:hypothetical protein
VLVKDDSPIHAFADLNGKRVMYIIGSTGDERLKRMLTTAQLLGFRSPTEAFSSFYAGRGDAVSTDDTVLYGFLHEYCGLRMLPEKLSEEPYGIAFRQEPNSQPLHDRVQEVLDSLQRSGYFESLVEKWSRTQPPANCQPLPRAPEAPAKTDSKEASANPALPAPAAKQAAPAAQGSSAPPAKTPAVSSRPVVGPAPCPVSGRCDDGCSVAGRGSCGNGCRACRCGRPKVILADFPHVVRSLCPVFSQHAASGAVVFHL